MGANRRAQRPAEEPQPLNVRYVPGGRRDVVGQHLGAGAVLAVIGDHDAPFVESPRAAEAVHDAIDLAFGTFAAFARAAD